MPYRRLPNTDKSRLLALKTLLDNNDVYTVKERFLDWKDVSEAKTSYDRLLTTVRQYDIDKKAQIRGRGNFDQLQRNAVLYVSHFMYVLRMCVERGEIKRSLLNMYGLPQDITILPSVQTIAPLLEWGKKIIEGEKLRIKQGGRPIYNPTIGMVSTHLDIFAESFSKQKALQKRTRDMEMRLKSMRPQIDELIVRIWNQVEDHFKTESLEDRLEHCSKYGIKYYYRKNEKND